MKGALAKEQSKAVLVGNICQTIVKAVLELNVKKGIISNLESEEPVVEVESVENKEDEEKAFSGNFILDFSFIRESDKKLICLWVSHRAKSDNSHTYFWGLVDEVRQVRKRDPDSLCIFVILGNKRGWKDWIFPASLLFFDYTFFIGDLRGDNILNFTFTNSKNIEDCAKKRLIVSETEDIDAIVQDMLNKGLSPDSIKEIARKALNGEEINGENESYYSRILKIYNSLEKNLSIQEFKNNEFVTQFYSEIQKLSRPLDSAREISTMVHKTGILEATAYLYVLLFRSVKRSEIIEVLRKFYDDENLAKTACDSLVCRRILLDKNSFLEVNPEIIAVLVKNIENMKGTQCTRDDLIMEFAYKPILPKLSKAQLQVLQKVKDVHLLSDGIDKILDTIYGQIQESNGKFGEYDLKVSKPTLRALYNILKNRKSLIKRREKILSDLLSVLSKNKLISEDSGRVQVKGSIEVNQDWYLFLHNLTTRTDLFDPYVLFLNKEYREGSVANAWSELMQVWRTDKLMEVIEKADENGIRIFFEVAIYAVGESSTTVRNITETAVASTGIWAFLRGDRNLSTSVKESISRFFNERRVLYHNWETISEEILKKRIQQIKRNSRINVLEEIVFAGLSQAKLIFLGTPEKQGDVYLRSMLNEVGLKCSISSSNGSRVEKRGEDFVVPTERGTCIAIQCRASPQSYEARRMAGHSLQFYVEWKNDRWVLRGNLVHVAIVDGNWKKEWVENLLDAGYDKVFSADEINQLLEYLKSSGAMKLSTHAYFEKLYELQSYFLTKEWTPSEILEQINKLKSFMQ
jgi:hypothetical protein